MAGLGGCRIARLWIKGLRMRVLGRVSRLERWFSILMMWSEVEGPMAKDFKLTRYSTYCNGMFMNQTVFDYLKSHRLAPFV